MKIMGPFDKSPSPIPTKKTYHHLNPDSLLTASQNDSITIIIEKFQGSIYYDFSRKKIKGIQIKQNDNL